MNILQETIFICSLTIFPSDSIHFYFPEFQQCTFKAFLFDPDIFYMDVFEHVLQANNKNNLVLMTTSIINETLHARDLLPYDFTFQEQCALSLFFESDKTSGRLLQRGRLNINHGDTYRTNAFSTMLVFTEILGDQPIYSTDSRHSVKLFYILVSRKFAEIKGKLK